MKAVKISLIIAILGIFFLLLMINVREPKHISIAEITEKDINKKVKIQGRIITIKKYDEQFQLITLQDDTGKIIATISDSRAMQKTLNKHEQIIIIGTVSQYKDTLQIETGKITLLE